MSAKANKRALLRARGWKRLSSNGGETWTHDRYGPEHFFSLAAAYLRETRAW